jgi:uncharacterized protein (TIRG00374 family)
MRILKLLLRVSISLGLIALVWRAFDVRGVGEHVADAGVGTLLATVAMMWLLMPPQALRWITVVKADGARLPFRTALQVVFIGSFFNQLLPSSIGGDAVRIWYVYREGLEVGSAFNTVIVDHACALLALLLIVGAGLPLLFDVVADPAARWALLAVVLGGFAGFAVAIVLGRMSQAAARWRMVRAVLGLAVLTRKVLTRARYAVPTITLSLAGIVGYSAIVFFIARTMQVQISLLHCVLLVPLVLLVTVVPVSIAGWGVREGAMVVALGFVGVAPAPALAISVVFGLTLAVASLPGSVLCWLSGHSVRALAADAGALVARAPDRGA